MDKYILEREVIVRQMMSSSGTTFTESVQINHIYYEVNKPASYWLNNLCTLEWLGLKRKIELDFKPTLGVF